MSTTWYYPQYDDIGKTIWVHASTGETVGRFDAKFGIDIHHTIHEQMNENKPQCLKCTHTKPTLQDFEMFCEHALTHWHITIDKSKITALQ
jgi:hypothetical protein